MWRFVVSGFRRTGLAVLVAMSGWVLFAPAVASQSRAPRYQVQALWPRPFADQSWVLGSITGVAVDAQNHIWVVHRGDDSLENNEKGMMLDTALVQHLLQGGAVRARVRSGRHPADELGRTRPGLSVAAVARRPGGRCEGQRLDHRRRARADASARARAERSDCR